MLISLIRATFLYVFIILSMRILGKRQIGELQPAELVVTILLSEMLVIPMQDNDVPLLNSIVPVMLIIGFEIVVSYISMKNVKFRTIMQGNSVIVIRNGKIDEKQLRNLRFTTDDMLEALRKKDVFDITTVEYAIVETDGTISVLLKSEYETVCNKDMKIHAEESTFHSVIVSDGEIITSDLKECGINREGVEKLLKKHKLKKEEIILMTLDKNGNIGLFKKESK